MEIKAAIGIAAGISTLVTIGGTKLWDAYRMEKKYRTKTEAEKCMAERKEAERGVLNQLAKIDKRMILGNLVIADLCEQAKIPLTKIASYEKAIGLKLRDNNE